MALSMLRSRRLQACVSAMRFAEFVPGDITITTIRVSAFSGGRADNQE